MKKESGEQGQQWKTCALVWHNGSRSDEVANQSWKGRYELFFEVETWTKNVVGYYSGRLFYEKVYDRQHGDKTFGEVVQYVNVKDSQTYYEYKSEVVKDPDGNRHKAMIMPKLPISCCTSRTSLIWKGTKL